MHPKFSSNGHLVMSTLHSIDVSKTVERIAGLFPLAEQHVIRNRLGKSFRYIVSQRLIPLKDANGRVAAPGNLKGYAADGNMWRRTKSKARPCSMLCGSALLKECSTSTVRSKS
jgi:twitching motility protein PilT